ncbi:S8 family serine peptidase [Phytoactinopolyspora limicola]|uniref:S8 family serine peptidase n=1 Tax=Phytoactinopolyspora limicola TaxID=2715536 RepID=UPI001A9C65B1|nr:S8 family serine peptidase [Phytoactinopolyspora limicola]
MGKPHVRRFAAGTVAVGAALALGMSPLGPAHATSATDDDVEILAADEPDRIPGVYIVNLVEEPGTQSEDDVNDAADALIDEYGGDVRFVYHAALTGFSLETTEDAALELAADSRVASVEAVGMARIANETQPNPPSWGIDRIDQRNLPLDRRFTYPTSAGTGVTVYVLDTGNRHTHQDFGNRARGGRDFITPGGNSVDCNGHGTHVASSAVGSAYGVAKRASTVAVRVLGCDGSGSWDGIVGGVDWVTANGQRPAVVNMSLGGSGSQPSLENAVRRSINAGFQYSIAAGNSGVNACNFTPARTPEAITVGSTQSSDGRSVHPGWASNVGTCLDIFAPGSSITAAWHTSNTATNTISGTSMAAPHVAGAAALYLSENRNATAQQVKAALVNNATTGVVTNPGAGSPNRLLYTGFIQGGEPPDDDDFSMTVSPGSGAVEPGGSVTATINTQVTSGDPQQVTLSASGLPAGASADIDPSSIQSGQSATLTISTSASTPTGTYNVRIDGDGTEVDRNATFRLTVTGDDPDGPQADFTYGCMTSTVCYFDGYRSSGDHPIVSYNWNFGDGNTGEGWMVFNVFSSPGTYDVTLTVTDSTGATGTITKPVSTVG